ncbi:hypothetical protein [Streptomyces sp. NPDC057580]|uniref:hypothetical protein n=1 Tax=Streptomyces sp. NPDC057580 TaxID=3346173 RepID=UPI0036D1AF1A
MAPALIIAILSFSWHAGDWDLREQVGGVADDQPAVWGTLISVDNSQYAVPIERLLERAINHLPVLIADTITEVST